MENGRRRPFKPAVTPQLFRANPLRKSGASGVDPLLLAPDVLDDATRRELLQDVLRPRQVSPSSTDQPIRVDKRAGDALAEKEPFVDHLRVRVRTGSRANSEDLVTAMAARLKDLETKHKAYQSEMQELHAKYRHLNDAYQRERQLREEAETAVLTLYDEKELLEMQLRRRDEGAAGLSTAHVTPQKSRSPTGHSRPSTQEVASSSPQEPASRPKGEKLDLFSGLFTDDDLNSAGAREDDPAKRFVNTAQPGRPLFSPQKETHQHGHRLSAAAVDVALLRKNARILSDYVGGKGVVKTGNQAAIRERDVVRVAVYKNGICVNKGPFRPYGWALCDAFLDDLAEGYYPYEFKEKYPDGFPIEVTDRSMETCETDRNGAVRGTNASTSSPSAPVTSPSFPKEGGQRLGGAAKNKGALLSNVHALEGQESAAAYTPISAREFLNRIPAQKVTESGQLVSVRDAVAKLMGITPKAPPGGPETDRAVASKRMHAAEAAQRRASVQPLNPGSCIAQISSAQAHSSPAVNTRAEETQMAILIRMPAGEKVTLRAGPQSTIAALRRDLAAIVPSFPITQYEFYQAFPKKLECKDHQSTLAEIGITKSCALMLKLRK